MRGLRTTKLHIRTRVYDDILCTRSRVCAVDDQQPAVVAARDSRLLENNTPLFIRDAGCDLHNINITYIYIRLRHERVGGGGGNAEGVRRQL